MPSSKSPSVDGFVEHETGCPLVHLPAQVLEVEVPAGVGLHLRELVPRHRDARRVRPVRGVGGDDRVSLLAAIGEVRAHEHEPGELALRPGGRLQRHGRKARHLGEDLLQVPHQLERALRVLVLRMRVQVAEPRERGRALVDARVVLHGARAERVEARVDAEGAVGERREVPHDLRLGELGKARRMCAAQAVRELGDGEVGSRRAPGSATRARALEDERRVAPGASRLGAHAHTSSSTAASRSTSSTLFFSVTDTSRTSSMPS